MDREIVLNFKRDEVEKLFMPKEDGSYLTGKYFAPSLGYALLFSVILSLLIFLERFGNVPFGLYIFIAPLAAIYLGKYIFRVIEIYRYKKSIHTWLDHVSKYKDFRVHISDASISLSMDEVRTIQKWSAIHYCTMDERRIKLKGETEFLLPASCMTKDEFTFLREAITNRLSKDVLDVEDSDEKQPSVSESVSQGE